MLPEEQRAHERQFFEIFERNRLLEQLPFLLKGKELVDKLSRIREEVVIVVLVSAKAKQLKTLQVEQLTMTVYQKRSERFHKIPEAVVLGFWLARTRNFFGIDQMSRPPIALDESPRASNVHCVPTIPESIVLEANARLITSRFAVTLYYYTVQSRVAVRKRNRMSREKVFHSSNFETWASFHGVNYYFGACRGNDRSH